jgi:two-component system response regulator FlrC
MSAPRSAVDVRSLDGLDRSATSLGDTQVYQPAAQPGAYGGRAAEEIAAAALQAAGAAGAVVGGGVAARDGSPAAQDEALPDLGSAIRNSEQRAIAAALRATSNRVEAAKALGISPRTLRYKLAQLRDHGLSVVGA